MSNITGDAHITFLTGSAVEHEIKELISKATWVKAAVAYWGTGSLDWLGAELRPEIDFVIVCDLMSGACDPKEIKKIRERLGSSKMLTLDGLHAKVWLTDRGAILGSSNVSANGLGFNGKELRGSIEANVFFNDVEMLTTIGSWFENNVMCKAREIGATDFRAAGRRYKRHRNNRPPSYNERTLLSELVNNPASLVDRSIFVWVQPPRREIDTWADDILEAQQELRSNDSILCWQDVFVRVPPDGSHVIDIGLG